MASGPVGLWVDWDGDGFGTGDNDDLTALVTHARYSRGSSPEITGAAQAGQAVFTVQNPGALFNPDNASGPLYGLLRDGAPVWWGMREDGTISGSSTATVRGRFAGRVVEVVPLPVPGAGDSTPLAQIICEDPLALYGRIPVKLSDNCSPPISCTDLTPPLTFAALGGPVSNALGMLHYIHAGDVHPEVPMPFLANGYYFPAYNYLGTGVDYGGNCVTNDMLITGFVGAGTLTVPTVHGPDSVTPDCIKAILQHRVPGASNPTTDEIQYGVAGDTFTFTVTTDGATDCTHWVDVKQQLAADKIISGCSDSGCGHSLFGYAGDATWVPV